MRRRNAETERQRDKHETVFCRQGTHYEDGEGGTIKGVSEKGDD